MGNLEPKLKSLVGWFGIQAKVPSGVTKDPHCTLIYGNTLQSVLKILTVFIYVAMDLWP